MTPEQSDALAQLLPMIVGALSSVIPWVITVATPWLVRWLWQWSKRLDNIETKLDAQRKDLDRVALRSEANLELHQNLSVDVLTQAATQAHRVERVALTLENLEERAEERMRQLSVRAGKHSRKIEAITIPNQPHVPHIPHGQPPRPRPAPRTPAPAPADDVFGGNRPRKDPRRS